MAQDFAPLLRSIWSDDDWRALSMDAQHIYLMLLSHPDRNSAGVLSLTKKKWTRLAADMTPQRPRLSAALDRAGLTTGFVVVDEETEEVLVRAFIRRATVYKHIRMLGMRCGRRRKWSPSGFGRRWVRSFGGCRSWRSRRTTRRCARRPKRPSFGSTTSLR
jgi:hypothetical protein